jgi:hypothetical protein
LIFSSCSCAVIDSESVGKEEENEVIMVALMGVVGALLKGT